LQLLTTNGISYIISQVILISIDELVKHEETGYIFKDSRELASLLKVRFNNSSFIEKQETFSEYPKGVRIFEKFKRNIEKFRSKSFDDGKYSCNFEKFNIYKEWRENVLPIVESIEKGKEKSA